MPEIKEPSLAKSLTKVIDESLRPERYGLGTAPPKVGPAEAEKKGTGRLFCEPIDGTCSGVLV
jgi:hypothetical protein